MSALRDNYTKGTVMLVETLTKQSYRGNYGIKRTKSNDEMSGNRMVIHTADATC